MNSVWLARAVSTILSWLDSANLRNRVYQQAERIEILTLALEDIERVNQGKNALIDRICQQVNTRYDRGN